MRDLSPEAVFRVAMRALEGTARNVSEQVILAE
jgi:hypothetical protein